MSFEQLKKQLEQGKLTQDEFEAKCKELGMDKDGNKLEPQLTEDIKAYINGAEIPAYNVDGSMIIIGADLRSYGFDVVYDNTDRTSSVSLSADGGTWNPIIITADDSLEVGTEIMSVYETDITMVVNGTPVTGYNVDGRMAFRFAELAVFGSYCYDNGNRSTNLWIG